ncbi:hypothetical protein CB1_000531010 [Camelus ferus]|nr:hypothetical protein CB1_000796003 [Camelus ferus]EPY83783.1 hypothetical protein CB1_000531010 [Camelus ferus]
MQPEGSLGVPPSLARGSPRHSAQQSVFRVQKLLGIAMELFLLCSDDAESDVRMVADECLNKVIKFMSPAALATSFWGPFAFANELLEFGVQEQNGAPRSLRAALWRFAELAHLVRPQKCRPYLVNLLPCLARASKRPEESVQETLAAAVPKIMASFGNFANDSEIKVLLKAFIANLKSSSPTVRRTAASSAVSICQHSRRTQYFYSWLLSVLLGEMRAWSGLSLRGGGCSLHFSALSCAGVTVETSAVGAAGRCAQQVAGAASPLGSGARWEGCPCQCSRAGLLGLLIPVGEEPSTLLTLGVLLTLRYLVPLLQQQVKDTSLKGSFGVTRKEMEVSPSAEQLGQVYELTLHYTQHQDHNVVTGALELLQQLLRTPPPELLQALTSAGGLGQQLILPLRTSPAVGAAVGASWSFWVGVSRLYAAPVAMGLTALRGEAAAGRLGRGEALAQFSLVHRSGRPRSACSSCFRDWVVFYKGKVLFGEAATLEDDSESRSDGSSPAFTASVKDELSGELAASSGVSTPGSAGSAADPGGHDIITEQPRSQHTLQPDSADLTGCDLASTATDGDEEDILSHSSSQMSAVPSDPAMDQNDGTQASSPVLDGADGQCAGIQAGQSQDQDEDEDVAGALPDEDSSRSSSAAHLLRSPGHSRQPSNRSLDKVASRDGAAEPGDQESKPCRIRGDIGQSTDDESAPLVHCVRLLSASFLLTGEKNALAPDRDVRVSVKALALSCVGAAVALHPESFFSTLYKVPLDTVECPDEQYVSDVLNYIDHGDPQVRGATAILCGTLVSSILSRVQGRLRLRLRKPWPVCSGGDDISRGAGPGSRVLGLAVAVMRRTVSLFTTGQCLRDEPYFYARLVPKLFYKCDQGQADPVVAVAREQSSVDLKLLMHEVQPPSHFSVSTVTRVPPLSASDESRKSCTVGMVTVILTLLSSAWFPLDLSAHQDALILAGNLLAASAPRSLRSSWTSEEEASPAATKQEEAWPALGDRALVPVVEQLFSHLLKVLNICAHVLDDVAPGPAIKAALPSLTNPPSLSPIRRKGKEKEAGEPPSVPVSPRKGGEASPGKAPPMLSCRPPHYHPVPLEVTLDLQSSTEKFGGFLRSALDVLSQVLELATLQDIGKCVEEILGYLKSCFSREPTMATVCVQQLLKTLFGTNLASQFDGLSSNPSKSQGRAQRLGSSSVRPGLYHYCFMAPYTHFTQALADASLRNMVQAEQDRDPSGWFDVLQKVSTQLKTNLSGVTKNRADKNAIHNHIRLFEPLVIKALKQYTTTTSVQLQKQVLDLLAQLVQLRVNYCLLDSDQVFIGFVLKQFEYIEVGQFRESEAIIPNIFFFLVLLSYERYHSKQIIGIPKIIQLCDGVMASGRKGLRRTHRAKCGLGPIPALRPIVHDLFVLRGTNKADAGKELETQKEVVVSMLLRLIQYHQVLEMFVLVLQQCHKESEDKWKRLSRQVADVILPMLAKQQVGGRPSCSPWRRCEPSVTYLFSFFEASVSTVQLWVSGILAILRVLVSQSTEDIVLARVQELAFPPCLLSCPVVSRLRGGGGGSVPEEHSEGGQAKSPPEETFSRFLLQLVGILLEDIVTKQLRVEMSEQQHTFYCQELGTLLMCLIHIFKSGMFRRITAAASRLFTEGADGSFYGLECLNAWVRSMVPTHPALVLLWCQILLLVSHTDYRWWAEVQQTPKSVYMCGGEGFGAPPPQAESSVQGFRKARAHGEERKVWR